MLVQACAQLHTHTHLITIVSIHRRIWLSKDGIFPSVILYVSAFKELKVGVSAIFLDVLPNQHGELGTLGWAGWSPFRIAVWFKAVRVCHRVLYTSVMNTELVCLASRKQNIYKYIGKSQRIDFTFNWSAPFLPSYTQRRKKGKGITDEERPWPGQEGACALNTGSPANEWPKGHFRGLWILPFLCMRL